MKLSTPLTAIATIVLLTGPMLVNAGPIVQLDAVSRAGTDRVYYKVGTGSQILSSTGGGVTQWRIGTDLTGTGFEWLGGLGDTFASVCLEPTEGRQNGLFELVELKAAPTRPRAMQQSAAAGLERLFSTFSDTGQDLTTLDLNRRTALQSVVWESSQEGPGNDYDRRTGAFRTWVGMSTLYATGYDNVVTSMRDITVEGFAMIAVNADGSDRRRQDFAFYNPDPASAEIDTVPVPAPLALMGLGLAGLGFTRFRARRA